MNRHAVIVLAVVLAMVSPCAGATADELRGLELDDVVVAFDVQGRGLPLTVAFLSIERAAGITIVTDRLDESTRITSDIERMPVSRMLERLARDFELTYEVRAPRTLVVRPAER